MARKPMTEEQKEKARQSLAKAREAQKAKREAAQQPEVERPVPREEAPAEPSPEQPAQPDLKDELLFRLMREMDELKKQLNPAATPDMKVDHLAQMQGVTIGQRGVQGKMFRYPIEQDYYPDPTERLYDEQSLARFGLRLNYKFTWKVEGVEYEKYGVTYAEPKFTVRLFRRMFDDTGTETGKAALINTQVLHEDEIVARRAADKLGITDQFSDMAELMNEVRYLRIRQWLLDLFTPPSVDQHKGKPLSTVVDGKVVEMYDTETLIDGGDGIDKARSVTRSTRI